MNEHRHDHPGHHAGHHSDHQHEDQARWQYHKDWRVWVAVVVILAAMATYVLTNGEVLRPGGPRPNTPVPIDSK